MTGNTGITAHASTVNRDFCYFLDRDGRQHFSFPQRIWLQPRVRMARTLAPSTALSTLAVNLLAQAMSERRTSARSASARARRLARSFCQQCLLPAPEKSWAIPRAAILEWIDAQRRRPRN